MLHEITWIFSILIQTIENNLKLWWLVIIICIPLLKAKSRDSTTGGPGNPAGSMAGGPGDLESVVSRAAFARQTSIGMHTLFALASQTYPVLQKHRLLPQISAQLPVSSISAQLQTRPHRFISSFKPHSVKYLYKLILDLIKNKKTVHRIEKNNVARKHESFKGQSLHQKVRFSWKFWLSRN